MNEDVRNQIRLLREAEQITIRDLSNKFGLSNKTVNKIVKDLPLTRPPQRSHLIPTWKAQARADALAGMDRAELQAKYQRSKSVINRVLENLGLPRKKTGGSSKAHMKQAAERRERVRQLRLEGRDAKDIAAMIGLALRTVQGMAKDEGVPFRADVRTGKTKTEVSRVHETIRQMRLQGKGSAEIAEAVGLARATVQHIAKRIGHPFVHVVPIVRRSAVTGLKKSNQAFTKKHRPISDAEARYRQNRGRISSQMSQYNNRVALQKITLPRLSILESEDA